MARRLNQEGTFSHKSDGRWHGKVWLTTPNGGRRRFERYGKTRAEAVAKIKELVKAQEAGVLSTKKVPTLGEYLQGWWNDPALKPKSLETRRLNVERVTNAIGSVSLPKVTAAHIKQMDASLASQRTGEPLSGGTRRQAFAVLRTALRQAVIMGMIPVSPYARVTWSPKAGEQQWRVLSMSEQGKLFSIDTEFTTLWKILLATGMRIGEALGLTWQAIDWDAETLRIYQAAQDCRIDDNHPHGYRIVNPKTSKSRRTLKLDRAVMDVLHEIESRQRAMFESYDDDGEMVWHTGLRPYQQGEPWSLRNESGFVFARADGKPRRGDSVGKTLGREIKRLDLPHAHPHDLRHSYASHQLLAGTPMLQVSQALGHSDVAFTMRVYGHILPETQEAAASTAGRLLLEATQLASLEREKVLEVVA
jgi:integrase